VIEDPLNRRLVHVLTLGVVVNSLVGLALVVVAFILWCPSASFAAGISFAVSFGMQRWRREILERERDGRRPT
jgi:hypothetical protein